MPYISLHSAPTCQVGLAPPCTALNRCSLSLTLSPRFTSISFMSSTGQTTSSTFNVELIINAALADYTKITGTDLSETPFAAAIERSNSLEAILQLLQDREKAFKEHREGNRRLINCLSPAVSVIQAFSGILGEAVSLVSHTCHPMTLFQINNDLIRSPFHQQMLCLPALILSLQYVLSIPFSRAPFDE